MLIVVVGAELDPQPMSGAMDRATIRVRGRDGPVVMCASPGENGCLLTDGGCRRILNRSNSHVLEDRTFRGAFFSV
jgi:hypothetical protein